jgi:tripartite-type tricarboxylate transporter receptor subunit TctC
MTTHRFTIARRGALLGAGASLALPGMARAQAQGPVWPAGRPITLVVPFPPGGQTDFAARMAQPGLATALGGTMVIDNRAGAAGVVGTDAVLRARPDGFTMVSANSATQTIAPHTLPNMGIDPLRLTPIGLLLQSSLILVVHPSLPVRNVAEFTAWAKAQGNRANYATSSAGALTHVTMELFKNRIGAPDMVAVPYRGSGPMLQDLIANRLPCAFDAASVVAPFLKSGQLRGIMVTGASRVPAFPDIPTAAEQGISDFEITAWIGLMGPPDLPAEIVERTNAALRTAMADPDTAKKITDQGDEAGGTLSAAALGARMRREHTLWGEVVKRAGIKVE